MEENKFIVFKDWPLDGLNWFGNYSGSLGYIYEHMKPPTGSKYVYADETPGDLQFAECYTFDWDNIETGVIASYVFKKEEAIESFKNYMRTAREDKFKLLDADFMKALEIANASKLTEIAEKKNELRNITNMDFSQTNTSAELKSMWPIELLGNSPF
jgi:hypothetical protein